MQLRQIYQPIQGELKKVEEVLKTSLTASKNESVLNINRFLLSSSGKRLRPALVILCFRAVSGHRAPLTIQRLAKIASSMELIHIASLIHDDVIDHAALRHNQPTVNSKWGNDVSIALGDYLYSEAFRLISECGNADVIRCVSTATKAMCEGELIQVCERDNLDLLKERYYLIVKKKTASLFAASCQAGAIVSERPRITQNALKNYGLNFGIAFQIVDDCLDLIGKPKELGKSPGADFKMGELTLPVLNLFSQEKDKRSIMHLLRQQARYKAFQDLRQRFIKSEALARTQKDILSYINKAKRNLRFIKDSTYKSGLYKLADYITLRVSSLK